MDVGVEVVGVCDVNGGDGGGTSDTTQIVGYVGKRLDGAALFRYESQIGIRSTQFMSVQTQVCCQELLV